MSDQRKRVNQNKTTTAALNRGTLAFQGLPSFKLSVWFYHHCDIGNQALQPPDFVHPVHSVHSVHFNKNEQDNDSDNEPC